MNQPPAAPSPNRRLRWFLVFVFGFFLVLAFLFFKDDALEDMDDLAPVEPPAASRGTAAYRAWAGAADLVDNNPISAAHRADHLFRHRQSGESPWDPALAAPVLVANQAALDAALHADSLGPFELPRPATTFSGGPHLPFHKVSTVLEIFTAAKLSGGDLDAASRTALAHLRMGENLIQQNTSLNGLLKGLSYHPFSIRMLDKICSAGPPPQLLDLIGQSLANDPDIYAAYDRASRHEFVRFATSLDEIADGDPRFETLDRGVPPIALFKRNRTQNDGAKFYRALLQTIAQPASKRPPLPYPQTPGEGLEQYSSNAFGDFLNSAYHFVHGGILDSIDLATATRRLLSAKVALLRYRLDVGALPPSLSELVPGYLDAVPLDPYDGAPLRYDPARGAIWVLGKDLIDGGGAGVTTLDYTFPDPTLHVDPPNS